MLNASLHVETSDPIAPVHRRTFGSFVEHMGRCVYTGIYEPGHPTAGPDGFRRDVADLVRELGVSTVRYPGGNFVSGYRWEDGVGPRDQRPVRRDLAWHSIETNQFGLDEFMSWCRTLDIEPMMAVNLGTRGLAEALDLLEYCNHPSGTRLSDQRAANGHPSPHDIRMWCLGNEMDGPWQIGHLDARSYGRKAAQVARAMKMADRDLELVVCGSSGSSMPTFGTWEATVLEEAYDAVDHISLHAYYEEHDGDLASFLASAADMDGFIESVAATADAVGARLRDPKRIQLSFDEWNVWYLSRHQAEAAVHPTDDWRIAPRVIEDRYNVADAVVVGNLLISLLRHSDRVTAASQAQLANVIAPIMTEPGGPAWRQTVFHPFALTARAARGQVLRTGLTAPGHGTERHGTVPVLDAVATHDEENGTVSLFVVNRSTDEPLTLDADLRALAPVAVTDAQTLSDEDPYAANTLETPDRVVPRPAEETRLEGGRLSAVLPPVSWSVITLSTGVS
ncbi:alpha-N-arabinofuranosidase [Nocardiopsis terrae]|uniref:non-reducing end alpha-L-arabinofuranosidase n=1 Tax=Nocardiopsis terrae TaxID=372655 RepID=A0ABR9HI22_9ACTN|nr:alpha-N-arabinofuranosidase [Nocardiopsis terrae]MBE1458673.1 alpha-N-arabinofuranosidase [Nocardiopsis terrae]GHC79128.1 alpha-N-arabinofuranosidase [Nocardiopsis terrae]